MRRSLATAAAAALLVLATAYLGFKVVQLAGSVGYDFRYLWLAGELWAEGTNPYGPAYQAAGETVYAEGHQPVMWVYPPTWFALLAPFVSLGPEAANVAWNLLSVALLAGSSVVLTASALSAFPELRRRLRKITGGADPRLVLFALHLFLLAVLEATALHLSVGQTSLLTLFGLSLLLAGLVRERPLLAAVGLAIVLLKPQIGLGFLVFLLLLGRPGWRIVGLAAAISLALCIPATIIAPLVILDFLQNLLGYDDFTAANLPQSMTGLRLIVWQAASVDIGNPLATLATMLAVAAAMAGPLRIARAAEPVVRIWQEMAIVTALVVALAPLHVYDLVLVALPLLVLWAGSASGWATTAAGVALMWRSENLADATGLHPAGVEIFPGSLLATLGAFLLLLATVAAAAALNRRDLPLSVSRTA